MIICETQLPIVWDSELKLVAQRFTLTIGGERNQQLLDQPNEVNWNSIIDPKQCHYGIPKLT